MSDDEDFYGGYGEEPDETDEPFGDLYGEDLYPLMDDFREDIRDEINAFERVGIVSDPFKQRFKNIKIKDWILAERMIEALRREIGEFELKYMNPTAISAAYKAITNDNGILIEYDKDKGLYQHDKDKLNALAETYQKATSVDKDKFKSAMMRYIKFWWLFYKKG